MAIEFYRERDEPYGCFSNFSPHGFEIDGMSWQTIEHYFQAVKFVGTPHEEAVRLAKSPMEAKTMGNDRARPLRPDWEAVKDDLMRRAVRAKFEQQPDIRAVLLGTGDEEIIEAAYNDSYWGWGPDKKGKNMLGKILMEIRDELSRCYTARRTGLIHGGEVGQENTESVKRREQQQLLDTYDFRYLGNGPEATGSEPGWDMGRGLYFKCALCGYLMDSDMQTHDQCFCGAMSRDFEWGRFGSRLGDERIEVYQPIPKASNGAA